MKHFRNTLALILFSPLLLAANNLNDVAANDVMRSQLINAKINGMCGAIYQMLSFHVSTKMEGGTEFINRFLNTEAARLGHKDAEAFLSQCKESTATYEIMMEALSTSEQKDKN